MPRSWIDRLLGRDDDDYEYEEGPEEEETVSRRPTPPLEPPVIPSAENLPPAVGPGLEAPVLSRGVEPSPAPPPVEPPSAVRAVGAWAHRDSVTLLNELPASIRERIAEALMLWHDSESQLTQSHKQSRTILEQTDHLLATSLSDPEFEGDASQLRQAASLMEVSLASLLGRNRARVREWIITAVQLQKSWPPVKVIRLFDLTGCGPLTLDDLQTRLRSMDAGPRVWAAEALGQIADPGAGAALLGLLRDPDPDVRATAVSALGRQADPSLLHHLSAVIKRDPDWNVRLRAIDAARHTEGYEAIGFLHELLKDRGFWRELQVLASVDKADAVAPGFPADARAGAYERVWSSVVDSILEKIQTALSVADPAHRGWLLEVLGDTGDARSVPLLSSALHDTDLDVRLKAIRGLGKLGGQATVDLIIPALKDQHPQVRVQAAQALGDANDFRAVEPLLEAMKDTDQYVRGAVAVAVGRIVDTRALKPLLAALNDPDKDVREQTRNAMRSMSDPRTTALVMGLLESGKKTGP